MDCLLKALVLNKEARVYIVSNTDTVNEAIKRHNLWPGATSVLGKTLTIAQIMGSMLKGDEALTIKINGGNGQLGNIVVLRFQYLLEYLVDHKSEIDRVILLDGRDAGLFGDYFAKFIHQQLVG